MTRSHLAAQLEMIAAGAFGRVGGVGSAVSADRLQDMAAIFMSDIQRLVPGLQAGQGSSDFQVFTELGASHGFGTDLQSLTTPLACPGTHPLCRYCSWPTHEQVGDINSSGFYACAIK